MLGREVYQIPRSYGISYLGQTGKSFQAWIKEHIANTFHIHICKSAIAEHSHNDEHLIWFDEAKIFYTEPH